MKTIVNFKNIKSNDHIEKRISQKSKKMLRYLPEDTKFTWAIQKDGPDFKGDVKLSGSNLNFHIFDKCEDVLLLVDSLTKRLAKQVKRKIDKWKDHKGQTATHDLDVIKKSEELWLEYEASILDEEENLKKIG